MKLKVFIGYDNRFSDAYMVAAKSLLDHASIDVEIIPLLLPHLRALGEYNRPTIQNNGQFVDLISDAPMATEFAISRFLCPYLSNYEGVSIFCDNDFLFRADIAELLAQFDPQYAVQCVKHKHEAREEKKMNGQIQTAYARKNWSSLMMFNNEHPYNRRLDWPLVNHARGRDLHQFFWLPDSMIGPLPAEWNWLAGISPLENEPKAVHYTLGTPDFEGYENSAYASEWFKVLRGLKCESVT